MVMVMVNVSGMMMMTILSDADNRVHGFCLVLEILDMNLEPVEWMLICLSMVLAQIMVDDVDVVHALVEKPGLLLLLHPDNSTVVH